MIIFQKIKKGLIMLQLFYYECFHQCNIIKMSVFFNRGGKILKWNWGDDINYWFLREIAANRIIDYKWSLKSRYINDTFMTCIGSIFTFYNMDHAIVWGTGTLSSSGKVQGVPKEIRAVRGPLTRQWLLGQGIDCPEVYGDPALLLPKYYQPQVQKKYKLGIVAHYVDQSNPLLESLRNDNDVLMIDIKNYGHWLDFIDQICQCEVIASSSLHGLIVSEAYGIPNVWIKLKGSDLKDDIKFHDFFLSMGIDRQPYNIDRNVTPQDILNIANNWTKGYLDIEPLIKACPLKLKENIKITRQNEERI